MIGEGKAAPLRLASGAIDEPGKGGMCGGGSAGELRVSPAQGVCSSPLLWRQRGMVPVTLCKIAPLQTFFVCACLGEQSSAKRVDV